MIINLDDIREQVKNCSLSRKEIAEKMKISYSRLTNKLGGFINFSPDELERLSKIISENQKGN